MAQGTIPSPVRLFFSFVLLINIAAAREVSELHCARIVDPNAQCEPSAEDLRQARKKFQCGIALQKRSNLAAAYEEFSAAASLVPKNAEYATAREVLRQRLVLDHIERGNRSTAANKPIEAMAEFRAALHLDSTNEFARQRLMDAFAASLPRTAQKVQAVTDLQPIELTPREGKRDFHFRGDSRRLLEQITREFGISPAFDTSFAARQVRFDLEAADFFTAMEAATRVTKTFWIPLTSTRILIASDTPAARRELERMAMRTFYLSETATAAELNEIANALRTILDIRFVSVQPASSTILVRGPTEAVEAATQLIAQMSAGRPQVLLDVKVYRVARSMLRRLGVDLPLQFQLFHISTEALQLAAVPNLQELINQLIASGTINQANTEAITALLQQLLNQRQSIFAQPFATFGGGLTLFGVTIPAAAASFSRNESTLSSLQHLTLRAADGNAATFRIGSRFPILNATFSPIFSSPELARVIQTGTFQAPFPSFSYEDLGITLKATPQVQADSVTLQLEMQIKALAGQDFNGVPVITNREYKGSINVKNGEPAVMTGMMSRSEQVSLRGLPGLSSLPVLRYLTGSESKEKIEDQFLLVITPHVVRDRAATEIVLSVPRS